MRKLVECVPNFSEGRDPAVIDAIAGSIRGTAGCTLLDVDPGASTNRTVYTFVGAPEAVVAGALAAARVARQRIDMRTQKGEHPRVGALDVCPFVPVSAVTMEDCVALANDFGRRVAAELGVPVYLYGHAAKADHRRTLQQIRAGEYEALGERIGKPEWKPDYGPAELVPEWGATCAGARDFLIAYNVNVLGTKEQAHRIALDIREQGRGPGSPGRLKAVRAIGWWVEEYALAQVSINLEDYRETPPHVAFEACAEEARRLGLGVVGSELVGLIPLQAVLAAADHYIAKEGLFVLDERQKIRLVVERLGLSSVQPFAPEKRIIEYMIPKADDEPLASTSVRGFVELLGSRTPAPGGGSASALIAAMGAALGAMVGWTTFGKRKFEGQDARMRRLIPVLHEAMKALLPMIDRDTRAFDAYLAAVGMPKDTAEEKAARHGAMQEGLRAAVSVPLDVMRAADRCWPAMAEMAEHGNPASRSDLEVGARALEAGIWGAFRNVSINLPGVEDEAFRQGVAQEAEALAARAAAMRDTVLQVVAVRSA
ncbi:MAG TPA: glutamate formimidoyltransferase [Vicinamibacteria bacterium]|nr:glutamate formimidoyltransferase [Vicinamibacteria bacterium]